MSSLGAPGECTPAHSGPAHYVWKVPGAPVHIRLSLEVVRRIREYLAGHSERDPKLEAGGLLLGKPHPPGVQIDDFAPVFRDEKSGPHFVLTDAQKPDLRNYIEEMNRLGGDLSVVGYFRSDVREGICLYQEDLALIKEFFPDRSNVFLVVRTAEEPRPTAGFFFWEDDSIFSSCSFMEFEFDEKMLTSVSYAVDSGKVPKANSDSPQQSAASEEASKADVTITPVLRRSRRRLLGAGMVVASGLAVGAFFLIPRSSFPRAKASAPGVPEPASRAVFQPPSVGLSVSRSGADISIIWNGQAPLVAGARVGILTIKDGGSQRDLPLTPAQLRSSRLIYTPQSDTVQVALEIFAHDGKVTRENVIAVSNAGAPPYRVEVPTDGGAQEAQLKPARDFVPPAVRVESLAPLAAAPSEPPPTLTTRIDVPRLDSPIVQQPAAPAPPPIRQEAPSPPAEKPSPLPQPVSQVVHQPPIPVRQVKPVLPPNVKAMLTSRANVRVRVQVDATGKVSAAEPLAVTGSLGRLLGAAAAGAARMWTFEPATDGQRKVPGELTLEFTFMPDRSTF